jgi:tRNA pseudouridine55 synthase
VSGGNDFAKDGIIVLDKPAGHTSQDAVSKARRATGIRKIGHTGTLDKFATGVLPLTVGSCTRISRFIVEGRKRYAAIFQFGEETDTLDPEGAVVRSAEIPSRETIESVLDGFRGPILQAPPEYSAIHIDGKRAYQIARSGDHPEMESRPVEIYSLELIDIDEAGRAGFRIECSKGTYVRSLARDIGKASASAAFVAQLRREETGGFGIDCSVPLESIGPASVLAFDAQMAAKTGMGSAMLKDSKLDDFLNGKKLCGEYFESIRNPEMTAHAVFSSEGIFRGVVSGIDKRPAYEMVAGRNQ